MQHVAVKVERQRVRPWIKRPSHVCVERDVATRPALTRKVRIPEGMISHSTYERKALQLDMRWAFRNGKPHCGGPLIQCIQKDFLLSCLPDLRNVAEEVVM